MNQERKQAEGIEKPATKKVLQATAELPIIASARTGLAGKDDAVVKRVPVEYSGKSVQDVLEYIANNAEGNEVSLAQSVMKEIRGSESIVVVNGKKAELTDKVEKYLVVKGHELPDKTQRQYRELEIEVSAVQRGGLYSLL